MRLLVASVIFIAMAVSAQAQTVPTPNEQFMQQAIGALRAQREAAADEAATARAQNAQLQAQIVELNKQIAALKTSASKAEAPKKSEDKPKKDGH